MDQIKADFLVTVVCGVVVAFCAGKRYNTPDTNRFSTTRSLFLLTGAGYIAACLTLFVVLCEIVLKPGILGFLGVSDAQTLVAKYTAPAILAAVILTTLLPNVTVLSAWDTWLLKRFQAWGSIPQGVRKLADTLTEKVLPLTEADLSGLRDWMLSDGDIPNELSSRVSADTDAASRAHLTRVLRLYQRLERLQKLPAYANAFRVQQEAWQANQADFRVFAAQSYAFFVLFDKLMPQEGTAGIDALNQARERYHDICEKIYERLIRFLAGLLLMVDGSDLLIKKRLQSIGFSIPDPEHTCPPLPVGPLVFMGVIIIIAILGVVSVVPNQNGPVPLAVIAILIGTTKTIGVLAAVLPKLRWSVFRPDSHGRLPYLASLAAATFAALVSFLIERAALPIVCPSHSISAALDFNQYPLTPMAPTTFAISLSIAILCDVDLRLGSGWARRIVDGIFCGAAMLVTLFICIRLIDLPSATESRTSFWFPYVFSFSLGFAAGLVAPNLYRRYRGEEPRVQTGSEIALAHAP